MPAVNPGIAKGYALDFAAPLRFVAERLDATAQTLDALAATYDHDAGDLARVWDHELRTRGQRRSAKPDVQSEREAAAKRWLLAAAIAALGSQVRTKGDRYALATPLANVRVGGLPVVLPETPHAAGGASPRASRGAKSSDRRRGASRPEPAATPAPAPAPAPEPAPAPPRNPLSEWLAANGYSEARLARALGIGRGELSAWIEGAAPAPRMVRLALWALEHEADI